MMLSVFFKGLRGWPVMAAAFVLTCCGGFGGAQAASSLVIPTEPGSGISVELEKPLSQAPPTGVFPMLVKIHNSSGDAGEWTVSTTSSYGNGASTQTPIHVEAGKSASVWIYAPVASQGSGGGAYRQIQVTFSGTKISSGSWSNMFSHSGSSGRTEEMYFPGLSGGVAGKGESALQEKFKKDNSGAELDSTRVDLEGEISDWRVFSGLGQLWMTDDEWSGMSSGSRAALMEWLMLGGRLVLMTRDPGAGHLAMMKVPVAGASGEHRVGAGKIMTLGWDGVSFPLGRAMTQLLLHDDGGFTPKLLSEYHAGWKLPEIVGVFAVHGWLIFGFIMAFGALVGPVNLFYFAGARRRHRLFWTTPLISLAGGALLMMVMLLQDGIGGHGARRVLAIMAPAQKKTAIVQEQVSRTGVLLGSSFVIPEPALIAQVSLSDPNVYSALGNRSRQLAESGDVRSGEWFTSRYVQAQLLQTVRPSRGGLEFYPGGGAPSVVSSLAAPLREVFIVDEKGQVWKAQDLAAGVKKVMGASSQEELEGWLQGDILRELGPVSKNLVERLRKEKEHAFATSDDADAMAIPTLKSIRWTNQKVFFAGPYEKR